MKKVFFFVIIALMAAGLYMAPGMVQSTIPSVYYITPNQKTYENIINCTGTVQSETVREVYLQSMIVPSEVLVSVGDFVNEGDMLVRVDTAMTEKMSVSALGVLANLSGNIPGMGINASGIDWASIASGYGLSAVISGAGVDYGSIQSLLEDAGGMNRQATSGVIVGGETPTEILAPMSGVITELDIRPETPAASGKAVVTIADNTHYKVVVSVGESDIAKVQVGDYAKIRGVGFGGSIYYGFVTKIYPYAKKNLSGSETVVDVEIGIENPDKRLKPGFSAKAEIAGGSLYDLITVPYEAVRQDENNNEYVYLYEDGKLKKQVIMTGQELTSEVEVLEGLDENSIVVYNPGGLVKEGAMINITGRANTDERG